MGKVKVFVQASHAEADADANAIAMKYATRIYLSLLTKN